jgi:M6 family metalloprotease-like protein
MILGPNADKSNKNKYAEFMSKRLPLVLSVIVISSVLATPAYSAAKAGTVCTKAGLISTSGGKKYTCIKSGKKLVWDKGALVSLSKPLPTASAVPSKSATPEVLKVDYSKTFSTDQGYYTDFKDPCQWDSALDSKWMAIQQYFYDINRCAGQIRINKYSLGTARPSTNFDSKALFANVEPCKLVTPKGVMTNNGFTTAESGRNRWSEERRYPSPNTVIQLIPIYAADTVEPKNSPAEDYSIYLKFLKDWIDYSSDFGSNVEIRTPSKYIKMDSKLSDFGILHTNNWQTPGHVAFNKAVVAASDDSIDFKGVNIAIVVPPAGTDTSVLGQATIGSLETKEGVVPVGMSEYAVLASTPNASTYSGLGHPFFWVHELMHSGYGFDDHYGDTKQDLNSEYGMGWLTLMTPFGGDLTTWEKWILGFMKDSQIQCVTAAGSSTHWIAPSTVKTTESKAIVIRVSATKAIVVETLRPGGLYYKIPMQTQGALVYEIDLTQAGHGMGMKLSLPIGRTVTSNPFFMASYPLKQGESTITNGYRITILESGTFGDVVKVEKA